MPQETNLNVAPYFDDFDPQSNYYKVLFKPGYPIQARELNNLQSILQNQVEDMGNHFFKEGSVVIPGNTNYNGAFYAIQIQEEFLGIPVSLYLDQIVGKTITGRSSGVTAKVITYITNQQSERGNYTLYLDYQNSSSTDAATRTFFDNEILITDSSINYATTFISAGEGFANTILTDASSVGSSFSVNQGIYFLRGHFVNVPSQILILDQYSNTPSYRIGFSVVENIISSDIDQTLTDNAQGFNNFSAPGADRFKISVNLTKKDPNDFEDTNFVQINEIINGVLKNNSNVTQYNELSKELARRTYDESGNYYVKPFTVTVNESLNDGEGNRGIYSPNQVTQTGNSPSEDLAVYRISSGKAYVKGYETEIRTTSLIDTKKPRTTKFIGEQSINFGFGPTIEVNRVYGSPTIGFNTTNVLSLRDQRVGTDQKTGSGKEIGVSRVYDFVLESGSYDTSTPDLNTWDLSLFDLQTYTDLTLNENVTVSTPAYIQGESSGASAYLRYDVSAGVGLTAYEVQGNFFIGENIIFNGVVDNSRFVTGVKNYEISDVQSVYGIVGTGGTFTADLVPKNVQTIGIASISARSSSGISTVTSPGVNFVGIATVGNLVRYSVPTNSDPTIARITAVTSGSLTIVGVTTVSGFCEGSNPTTSTSVTDLTVIESKLQTSAGSGNAVSNTSLFSIFPKRNIESVDLVNSNLIIRKQFTTAITSGETAQIDADPNETFLPFDEERYTLIRSNGSTVSLTADKVSITNGGNSIQIIGISGVDDIGATLTTTIRKTNITSKLKQKIISNSIVIDKSKISSSGIGQSTLNDGLVYGSYPFGTRVQDSVISLNVPDVIKIHGIFESNSTSDPESPSMTTASLDGPSATTNDLIIGDILTGSISGAKAIYLTRKTDTSIGFIYLNNNTFETNEIINFEQSGVSAVATNILTNSKNITGQFKLYNGQKNTIYDYSRIERLPQFQAPVRKIVVYYSKAQYDASDTGDITTVNSYSSFDYKNEISLISGNRVTDIIDARPRVSNYTVSAGARSPFEFYGRVFDGGQHSSKNIIASDESMALGYNYYLGRADRVNITPEGDTIVTYGVPDDNPKLPERVNDALNIANIYLPPYLYNVSDARVESVDYKRYQMSDIFKLEKRIKSLEYYSSISLLETETLNLFVPDANGLNKFKSGIFVDNFTTTDSQDISIGIKNSIDPKNKILRPSHYTTALNLQVGSNSIAGIGTTTSANQDSRYSQLLGSGVKRKGQVVTLDYTEVEYTKQPYATRIENVTPFLVQFWNGRIKLQPEEDIWIDVTNLEPRNITFDSAFNSVAESLNAEITVDENGNRIGVAPTVWSSWETVDTRAVGDPINLQRRSNTRRLGALGDNPWLITLETTTTTRDLEQLELQQLREGYDLTISESTQTESLGDRIVNRELIHFMRTRNIEFTGNAFKPFTRLYSFFEGVDVNKFTFNKLVEIEMNNGTFQVGETVVGTMPSSENSDLVNPAAVASIRFRVANSNHKYGPFNAPTDVFNQNPYDRNNLLPSTYSETSTVLNVDTFSLSNEDDDRFGGYIQSGMVLRGLSSGAQATVSDIRLITDRLGTIIGSFRVPDSSSNANPVFETGRSVFRLTASSSNSLIPGAASTAGEQIFYSQGELENRQETTLSIKNVEYEREDRTEERVVEDFQVTTNVAVNTFVVDTTPRGGGGGDPLAQTFYVPDTTGVFLTKLDVFFQSKAESLPVWCQIREVQLGTPSSTILPFSVVYLSPDQINLSDDGTVPTSFVFDSPVYLNPEREYAVVLQSDSTDYNVWISRLGEVEVSTLGAESGQVLVSEQPTLGSLFKSQNASVWTPSQYEDLKFTLYRANFNPQGSIQFFNPTLPSYLEEISQNGVSVNSRNLKIGIGTTIQDADLTLGNTITQNGSSATGNLVGYGGSATSTLTITNAGVGYTPSSGSYTFSGVALTSITGTGINATADIFINNGVAVGATINNGGKGYTVGDVLTPIQVGNSQLGTGMKLSVNQIYGLNELIVDNVQGEFLTGASNYLTFVNNVGVTTTLNYTVGGNVVPVSPIRVVTDGLHLKVFQRNHGLYSRVNNVTLSDIQSNIEPTSLTVSYSNTDIGSISIANTSSFGTFENVGVGSTNPGYVKIGSEIISYTSVTANSLNGITRGIDNTLIANHSSNDLVYKYEFDKVSLRRINKTHNLSDVTVPNPITLDSYYVKIDMSQNGTNRSSTSPTFKSLYFNENYVGAGLNAKGSYNLPFTQVLPKIKTINPKGTLTNTQIRTISQTSVSGNEASYFDKGFQDAANEFPVFFPDPRMIASQYNENQYLTSLTGNKSFAMDFSLVTSDTRLTPMIDLDKASAIFTNNRVNSPITNYATDPRVNTVYDDPHSFMYVTKNILLENPATSLKVYLDSYISNYNDVRVFYAINQNSPLKETIFVPFPGYANIDNSGNIINFANSNGSSDIFVPKVDTYTTSPDISLFREYTFTVDRMPPFSSFRIKIVGTSTNQSVVPQFKNLRVLALA